MGEVVETAQIIIRLQVSCTWLNKYKTKARTKSLTQVSQDSTVAVHDSVSPDTFNTLCEVYFPQQEYKLLKTADIFFTCYIYATQKCNVLNKQFLFDD